MSEEYAYAPIDLPKKKIKRLFSGKSRSKYQFNKSNMKTFLGLALLSLSLTVYGQLDFKLRPFRALIIRSEGNLFRERSQQTLIGTLREGDSVTVIGWAPWLVKVSYYDFVGYTGAAWIELPDSLREVISSKSEQLQAKQAAYLKRKRTVEIEKQFGKSIAARISRHEYWIGMTPDMATYSLGKPDKSIALFQHPR
jgi:hypothetical protein